MIKSIHKNIPTDDNLGHDVDGRESATIVMKTAIASSSVIPNPMRSPESTGNTNTFRTPINYRKYDVDHKKCWSSFECHGNV